jgi:plasmid stabilization system protein ParE
MKAKLRLRAEVVTDLTEIADSYNSQRPGLGNEFVHAAYDAFDIIAERPTSFPIAHKSVRRALMKRFPYAVYFESRDEAVEILVVIHSARSPRVWKKRLR